MNSFINKYMKFILLAIIIYFPLFSHLGTIPLRFWDESRLAMNAYEMYKNGFSIVTYYDGMPDTWNTKPPLLIWLQVLSFKAFGINELGLRLPSAVAAVLTCIALLVFLIKYIKDSWLAIACVLVLITTDGYIDYHTTRTGDYDALLLLFTTTSSLLFFSYTEKKKTSYLYLFFIFLTLAILTKGIAGLLLTPALVLYALISKKILPLLKNKHFYIGLISFLFISLGYYFLREAINTGYINWVIINELGGRYLETLEGHKHGFWYYYNNMVDFRIKAWIMLIPCGITAGFASKNKKIKRLTTFITLAIITYFLLISNSQTKLQWYDAPLFPFFAISVALFFKLIFDTIKQHKLLESVTTTNIAPFIITFLLCITPYRHIINKTFKPKDTGFNEKVYSIGHILQKATKEKINLNGKKILYSDYNAPFLFYVNKLNDKGIKIEFILQDSIKQGMDVIATLQPDTEFIDTTFVYTKNELSKYVSEYKILSEKNNAPH